MTSIGWVDPRTEHGQLLWPERFNRADVDDLKKRLGSYATAGQLQQRPSPAEGGRLKRHWWKYWQPAGASLPLVRVKQPDGTVMLVQAVELPGLEEKIQSWDMAFKDLASSDYVVGQAWGRFGANCFLLDQERDRMDFPSTLQAVRRLSAKHDCAAKLVEDKANGPAVIATLRDEIQGMIPVSPDGGKVARTAAVSPSIEAGNVYLPHPLLAPWVEGFIEECAAFPFGAHDDQVDSLSQALKRLNSSTSRSFLPEYRPLGPRVSETQNACHVVPRGTQLRAWWYRWVSLAWTPGDAVAHWYCQGDGGRVHVYRELALRGMSAEQAGAAVARESGEELALAKTLSVWIAPEHLEVGKGWRSVGHLISNGLQSVIGQDSVFLWAHTTDERMSDEDTRVKSIMQRKASMQSLRMTVMGAEDEPIAGWEHTRNLMRFQPVHQRELLQFDPEYALHLQSVEGGEEAAREYMRACFGDGANEVFPKLVIHEDCQKLIGSLSGLVRDEKRDGVPLELGENPAAKSLLLGMIAHRGTQAREPEEDFVARRMDGVLRRRPEADHHVLSMVATKAEKDWQSRATQKVYQFPTLRKRQRLGA